MPYRSLYYVVVSMGFVMAKEKLRFSIDVLFKALHSRKSRPRELENVAENQIVKAIIAQLRSGKLDRVAVRATERHLWNLIDSNDLNYLGKRRALSYFIRRKKQHKLKKSIERRVNEFCEKHSKTDWVKGALKHS